MIVHVSARVVLREPGGAAGGAGDSVAAHPGPVAGDRGEDGAAGQEDDLQGPPTSPQQPNSVNWRPLRRKICGGGDREGFLEESR